MANKNLSKAKNAKNDEFYTQYSDIETEVMAYLDYDKDVFRDKTILLPCDDPEWSNFTKFFAERFDEFGIKKLISTSYARNKKQVWVQPSLFEEEAPIYDKTKSQENGRIFILDRDSNNDGKINFDDLKWDYLSGDGDFRSEEVRKLRDEADLIITNPPFSLFREFVAWIFEDTDNGIVKHVRNEKDCHAELVSASPKKFLIIGNVNAITYKEVFSLIKKNKMWIGPSIHSGDRKFGVPNDYPLKAATCGIDENGQRFINVKGVRWFTNLEHGRRHEPLSLMTTQDNIQFSKHKEIKDIGYKKYDNYDAIEVPFTDSIPDDYDKVMGVPITFLDKYCPEQFEIVGLCASAGYDPKIVGIKKDETFKDSRPLINGKNTYARVYIRKRDSETSSK